MQQYWLAFTHVHGLGPIRLRQLRERFPGIREAWFADREELRAAGINQHIIDELVQVRQRLDPDRLLEQVQRLDAWVLTLDDPDFPPRLKEIDAAPVLLYGRGELLESDERSIAVVGTRGATEYGMKMTRDLVGALVKHDITIVSGLAYGIDIVAHRAALDSGGRTLAILGSGIDVIYPNQHRRTADEIMRAGAILTEFSPGTSPERGNFPFRNRIISGITLGTLVVEAPERSGSLQTAGLAGEQGREVFAVPGNAISPNSRGTNMLIQDGAKLVMDADDILRELNPAHQTAETRRVVQRITPTSDLEAHILKALMSEPLHVDELCRACQLSIQQVQVALTLMELKGLVYQTAPMTYHVAG